MVLFGQFKLTSCTIVVKPKETRFIAGHTTKESYFHELFRVSHNAAKCKF